MSLLHLGAQVFAISETPSTETQLFDLMNLGQQVAVTYGPSNDEHLLRQALNFAQADIVIHLGEFGSLQDTDKNPVELFSKSILSTNLLMNLMRETASVRSVVVVSSDKVYERTSNTNSINEDCKVAAKEILPTAKLCSELIALSYRHSYFNPTKYNKHKIAIATARLGSSIGGGDFARTSLVPQIVRSLLDGSSLEIRNPNSVRPWIHVLDQVNGLLKLSEALYLKGPKLAETYNLGATEYRSVGDVASEFANSWLKEGTSSLTLNEEKVDSASSIHNRLNSTLALQHFGWKPCWDLSTSLTKTVEWYQGYYRGDSVQHSVQSLTDFFLKKNQCLTSNIK